MATLDNTNRYAVNPTTTATAYATADSFGAPTGSVKLSPNGLTGAFLKHFDGVLKGSVAVPLDVQIYAGDLTTAVLDNAAFALAAADAFNLVARFQIAAADWVALPGVVSSAFSVHKDLGNLFIAGAGNYTVVLVVGTGGPFTPSVANALKLFLISEQAPAAS